MGIFERLFRPVNVADVGNLPIVSPWAADNHLAEIITADIVGVQTGAVTRSLAMKVPAVVKARAVICGTLARHPLKLLKDGREIPAAPWLVRTSYGDVQSRMLWTLDDLIFYGRSLWFLERNARGDVLDAMRVPYELWEIDGDGTIKVDDKPVAVDNACLILAPQDGLITIAETSIRGAIALEQAWTNRATAPVPLAELHITDQNTQLTDEEKKKLAADWEKQRRNGGTAVTPYEVELRVHGEATADLFIEGRNASRLDFANYLSVPGSLLEGSTSTASLTYSTREGQRDELVDISLAYWANAVEARLSQDDIVPRGQAVQFDIDYLARDTRIEQAPRKD